MKKVTATCIHVTSKSEHPIFVDGDIFKHREKENVLYICDCFSNETKDMFSAIELLIVSDGSIRARPTQLLKRVVERFTGTITINVE